MIDYVDAGKGYEAGACNIGPAEIRRRQQAGVIGAVATVGLGALLLLLDAPAPSRLLVALPAMLALSGFIQARSRFCAAYGFAGLRNLGALGQEEQVDDAAARSADRRKALGIFGASVLGGLAIGIAYALLPL